MCSKQWINGIKIDYTVQHEMDMGVGHEYFLKSNKEQAKYPV